MTAPSTHRQTGRRLARPRLVALAAAAACVLPAQAASFFWSSGDFITGVTAPEPLLAGDTLFITSGGTKRFVGSSFTNLGLVRWQADVLQGGNSASVLNSGIWQSEDDSNSLLWQFGGQPTFTNAGTFRKTAGANTNVGNWAFVNNGGLIDAQVGSITFNGSSNQFNAGSRFAGAGGVLVTGGGTFSGSFDSDSLTLAGGTATGAGATFAGGVASSAGHMGWTGGDLAGTWTIGANGTVTASGAAAKRQVGSNIVNNGRFVWDTTQQLQGGNSSVFTNNGEVEVRQSATFNWIFGGAPAYINSASGTVRASNNATLTFGNVALTSNGGLFTADPGSAIVYTGTQSRFNDGTRFVGNHQVNAQARFVGNIFSDDLRFVSGVQTGGDGNPGSSAIVRGQVRFQGGDLTGSWEIANGATMTGEGAAAKRQVGSSIVNNGRFVWDTTQMLQGGNSSVFTNNGEIEVRQNASFEWIFGGAPAYINSASGTIRASNNATLTFGNVALTSNGGLFTADAGSAIVYTGTQSRFNDGTRFVGNHQVNAQARFVGNIFSDDLRFVSGVQTGGDGNPGSSAIVRGQVRFQGGDLNGSWEIASGATMTGEDPNAGKRQVGSSIVNNGRFVWDTTQQLQGGNSSVFTNNGEIEVRQSAAFNWIFGGAPAYINSASGTVRASNGATLTFGNVALTSNGGLFTADPGSAIVYTGTQARFNDGTRFVGENQVNGSARFVDHIQAGSLRWVGGTQTGGDGSNGSMGRLGGNVVWESSDAQGAFEVKSGATLHATTAGGKRQVGGLIVNNGTILWDTTAMHQTGNSSRLENNGRYEMTQDSAIQWIFGGQGQVENNGLIIKTGGLGTSSLSSIALTNNGIIDVRSGTIALPTNFVNAGTLMGTGTFSVGGTLVNNGHIAPGSSPGTLNLQGALTFGSGGFFDVELEGLASHDLLLATGNVALNGTLALSCFGNCALSVGDEVTILDTAGQLSGSFAGVTLSGFGTGAFDVVYDYALDRVLLRVTENVTAPPIPEPGTYALMGSGLALVGWIARRRRLRG